MARASGVGVGGGGVTAANADRITYDAFISYSQRGDKAVARALRNVIQTVGKPWWKVRSLNVFLDATSLSAAPGLWDSIAAKLNRSRYLILLASPEAASSPWVDREVAHFVGEDGAAIDRMLIGLTDGDLRWDAGAGDFVWHKATPLPPSLRGRFKAEPLWVDLRPFRTQPSRATKSDQTFLHAALDLAATIKGVEKADLYSDELNQQRRSLRLAYGAAIVVAALAVGTGIAAWIAIESAREARSESDRANEAQREAEAQRDEALRGRTRLLTDLARQENERENFGGALAYIREAVASGLPIDAYPPTLEKELRTALANNREAAYFDLADHVDEAVVGEDALLGVRADGHTKLFSLLERRLLFDDRVDAGPLLGLGALSDRVVLVYQERIRILAPSGAVLADEKVDRIDGGEAPVVVFSPTGDTFLVIRLRSIDLRRVSDGGLIAELKGFHGGITSTAFSSDGSRIAAASSDDRGRVWSTATGAPLGALEGHQKNVNGIAFLGDGGELLTWSDDSSVREWAADGSLRRTFHGDGSSMASAIIARDGEIVVAVDEHGKLSIWNRADGTPLPVSPGFSWGDDGFLYRARQMPSFSRLLPLPNGRHVALVDPGIAVLNVDTLEIVAAPEQSAERVTTVGAALITWTSGDDVRFWNAGERGFYDAERMVGPDASFAGLWGAGDAIASLDREGALRFWDAGSRTQGFGIADADRVYLSPDSRTLIGLPPQSSEGTGLEAGEERSRPALLLRLDDPGSELQRGPVILGRAEAVAFSSDSRHAALSVEDGGISVIGLPEGNRIRLLPPGEIRSPEFLPGSDRLLQTVYAERTKEPEIRLWSLAGESPPPVVGGAILLGTSPDGKYIVAQDSETYRVRIWNTARSTFDASIERSLGAIDDATFLDSDLIWGLNRDSKIGFVLSISGGRRLWETALATGYDYIDGLAAVGERHIAVYRLGRDEKYYLEILDKFSGKRVLSVSIGFDTEVRFDRGDLHLAVSHLGIWNVASGEQVMSTPTADVAFTADGSAITLLTRGRFRQLHFAPLPDLLKTLNERARPLTDIERRRAFIE